MKLLTVGIRVMPMDYIARAAIFNYGSYLLLPAAIRTHPHP